jgi:hypothetical protein
MLLMENGTISANWLEGSAIGSGCSYRATYSIVTTFLIVNRAFTANCTYGSGIGSGDGGGLSLVRNLIIVDGTFAISASDGAGIGSAHVHDFG